MGNLLLSFIIIILIRNIYELLRSHKTSVCLHGLASLLIISLYAEDFWDLYSRSFISNSVLLYLVISLLLLTLSLEKITSWLNPLVCDKLYVKENFRSYYYAFIVTSFVGWFAYIYIYSAYDLEAEGSSWSGSITIFFLFSKLRILGIFYGILLFISSDRFYIKLFILMIILFYLYTSLIRFRREELVSFFIFLHLINAVMVHRKFKFVFFFIFAVCGFLLNKYTGEIRFVLGSMNNGFIVGEMNTISDLVIYSTEIDRLLFSDFGNFVRLVDTTGFNDFTWGSQIWYFFVFTTIPQQFVGDELKNFLLAGLKYTPPIDRTTGSTLTIFGDAYYAMGYVGFIFIFLIYFMAYWPLFTKLRSYIVFKVILLYATPAVLLSLSHGSPAIVGKFLEMLFCLMFSGFLFRK